MKSYHYILVNHDRNHSQTDKSVVHLKSEEVNYSNLELGCAPLSIYRKVQVVKYWQRLWNENMDLPIYLREAYLATCEI